MTELDNNNEEEVADNDVLLFTSDPGPRVFVLNNGKLTTLLGIVLEESEDSFLVALPSRLVGDPNTEVKIEPFINTPIFRLLKSSVMSVSLLFDPFAHPFVEYVLTTGEGMLSGISTYLGDDDVILPAMAELNTEDNTDLEQYLIDKSLKGEIGASTKTRQ